TRPASHAKNCMNAVDTNVLIYARDPAKQATADALLRSLTDAVLLWQVACEYIAAARKLEPLGFTRAQALSDVADMRAAWYAVEPTWAVMDRAEVLLAKYSLSFWDAVLVAACL